MAIDGNIRLDNVGAASTQLQEGAARPDVQGSLAGLKVTVSTSSESLLADAAEELTFGVDNTEEL
ncbi:MAG: SepL/TyeA/HrpJ family type III secretion system gatekeeper, partial [Deltaproteobacteria bacterium]|nr:SepL/TyeA/HrpJ family type III secretion system gatekeeper [Deltaproteobacteria bacterium]